MNRLVENTISAAVALLIGFYISTQWYGKEPAIAPAEPLAEPQVAHPAAPPPVNTDISRPSAVQPKPAAQAPQPACPEPEPASRRITHTEAVPGFDSKKLDAVYQQINSDDAQQRQQALLVLAKLGTEEVMADLIRAAVDDEESSSLRRELIQQIDWAGHSEELGRIISKSRDAEARLAAVNAVAAAEGFTEEEFAELGKAMINNYLIEPEEGIKIATLNCIQAVYPDSFQEVIEKYPQLLASPEVQNHLKMIATPPEQMEEAPAEIKSKDQEE